MIYNFIDEEQIGRKVRLMFRYVENKSIPKQKLTNYLKNDTMIKIRSYIKVIINEYNKNNRAKDKGKMTSEEYKTYLKRYKESQFNYVRNNLDDMLINYHDGFIIADWDSFLNNTINSILKNSICHKSNNINITKNELELINSTGDINGFKSIEIRKVLYILLILSKVGVNSEGEHWVNISSSKIFNLARFKYKTRSDKKIIQRELLLKEFSNMGLIEISNKSGIKILYYENEYSNDDIVKELGIYNKEDLDNIENVIVKYLSYNKEELKKNKYYFCTVCGKEIKVNPRCKKETKYCTKCAKEISNIQKKLYKTKINN